MSDEHIRVFVVDDHELLRAGLKAALETESDIRVVGEAARLAGTADTIAQLNPDVAVIDVRLGDGTGINLCRELQVRGVATRCLMFTSAAGEEGLYQSILAGASGYLLKNAAAEEIVDAVRAVAERGVLIDPTLAETLLARLRHRGRRSADDLTGRERQVLTLIGEGLTNAEIAARLNLAPQTVKNYVSRVLTKLDMNRTQSALYAAAKQADEEPR
jgi:DNA-binding NarL/FixJ family response regulator